MKKCEGCIHSRVIVSENGHHSVCCLPQKTAIGCMTERKDCFIALNKEDSGHTKE